MVVPGLTRKAGTVTAFAKDSPSSADIGNIIDLFLMLEYTRALHYGAARK